MNEWPTDLDETPIDPSGLNFRGITTRRELNRLEAENIRKAVVKYLSRKPSARLAPFTYDWCLRVHREMLGNVWKWAGAPRTRDYNLEVPFFSISDRLIALLDDLKSWSTFNADLLDQAAWLQHRAVAIHPFENGNGRWSRLLANIWLRQNGFPCVEWPDAVIGQASEIRGEYIAAIKAADAGDYDPLIALQKRFVNFR